MTGYLSKKEFIMQQIYYLFNHLSLLAVSLICAVTLFYLLRKPAAQKSSDKASESSAKIDSFWIVFLLLLFAVFLFSRLFHLSFLPAGLHLDEVGVTYDAFSLLNFGTDRLGRAYPVYPTNYGDGNSAMYTYLEMMVLKFLPLSVISIRLPAVLCSIPCFFASFGIVLEMYKNRAAALLGPLIVTVTPYFFMSERFGLDCNLMLSIVTVALYFLTKAVNSEKSRYYVLAGLFFGLTLYTYILSYLMLPLFFLLLFIYLMLTGKFSIRKFLSLCLPFGLLGIPLFLEQLVNMGILPEFHFLGSDFMRLDVYRSSELSLSRILKNLPNILYLLFGGDPLAFNSFNEFGPVFWCLIPLIILGCASGIKKGIRSIRSGSNLTLNRSDPLSGSDNFQDRKPEPAFIFVLYVFSIYLVSLLLASFNTYNSNGIYIGFAVLAAEGIMVLVKAPSPLLFRKISTVFVLCLTGIAFLLYGEFYFRRQIAVYGKLPVFISTEPGDMLKYVEETYSPEGDKKIYTEINYHERDYADICIALFTETDPSVWREYEENKETSSPAFMGNIAFNFPEEFDENEDAVYILGTDWNHIVSYLSSIGYSTDTSFDGYTIVYK